MDNDSTQHGNEPFEDAGLKSAVARAFAGEKAPPDVLARLRERLEAERHGGEHSADRDARTDTLPLRGRRLWISSAVAAAILLGATLVVVMILNGTPQPASAVLTDPIVTDACDVHQACSSPGHIEAHHARYVDASSPPVDQARAVADHVKIKDLLLRDRLGGYRLASCADCKLEGRGTVHLIYVRPGDGPEARREVVSVFVKPSVEADEGGRGIERIRYHDMDVVGFRHDGSDYILVGAGGAEELKEMARELLPGGRADGRAVARIRGSLPAFRL